MVRPTFVDDKILLSKEPISHLSNRVGADTAYVTRGRYHGCMTRPNGNLNSELSTNPYGSLTRQSSSPCRWRWGQVEYGLRMRSITESALPPARLRIVALHSVSHAKSYFGAYFGAQRLPRRFRGDSSCGFCDSGSSHLVIVLPSFYSRQKGVPHCQSYPSCGQTP